MSTYYKEDIEIISKERVFDGFFKIDRVLFKHKLFDGGYSRPVSREILLRNNAVAVLPYDPKLDKILLIEQVRIATLERTQSPWSYEVIAGIMEEGETKEGVAYRESKEEAGLEIEKLILAHSYFNSSGGTDEKTYVYLGICSLDNAGGYYGLPEEDEDIRAFVVDRKEAMRLLDEGKIENASALIALLWFKANFEQLFGDKDYVNRNTSR